MILYNRNKGFQLSHSHNQTKNYVTHIFFIEYNKSNVSQRVDSFYAMLSTEQESYIPYDKNFCIR